MTDYKAKALQVHEARRRKIDKARERFKSGETGVSARDREIARAQREARDTLAQLQQADHNERKQNQRKIARDLFGLPAVRQTALVAISYRDAQDRASQIGDPKEGHRLLTRAMNGGDDGLARAIAARAAEAGWKDVLVAYFKDKPEQAARYEEWATSIREENNLQGVFHRTAHYLLDTPSEIAKLQPHEVDKLADSEPAGNE